MASGPVFHKIKERKRMLTLELPEAQKRNIEIRLVLSPAQLVPTNSGIS